MKFSRDLIDLRDREQKLVRVKRYEEAEKVKMKADLLEEFERNKIEAEVSDYKPNNSDASCNPKEGAEVKTCATIITRRAS